MFKQILSKIGFAGLGYFGFLTILPNAMANDAGDICSTIVSITMLSGSAFMCTSGIMGIGGYTRLAINMGKTGLGLQFLPLCCIGIIGSVHDYYVKSSNTDNNE